MGLGKIGFDALILVAHLGHLGAGLVDLVAEGARMKAKLAIGVPQFGLFLFQQTFGGQSRAPFLRQLVREGHARPPPRRIVVGPQSGIVVKNGLTRARNHSASMASAMP
jgi:hypothetical protein